jgi:16S rRNA (uracil1498-N3)-methyltransferase
MRFYYLPPSADDAAPSVGDEAVLPTEESRHLVKVMRARVGDPLSLIDGRGRRLDAELVAVEAATSRVRIVSCTTDRREIARPRLYLACGVVKGRRFEWLLEKAAELGVHSIQPLQTTHGEIDPRPGKQDRWRTLLVSATKQSGRSWLPDLAPPRPLDDWLADRSGEGLYYGVARTRDQGWDGAGKDARSPGDLLADPRDPQGDLAWVVGPEGGWDQAELTALAAAGTPVRLGPHRLRTETAACAGLVLLASLRETLVAQLPVD